MSMNDMRPMRREFTFESTGSAEGTKESFPNCAKCCAVIQHVGPLGGQMDALNSVRASVDGVIICQCFRVALNEGI